MASHSEPRDAARAGRAKALELRIESLAAGGEGVSRDGDGRVVFVPFTAPGDRVRVRLVEQRARFARGRVEALLEAGDVRTDPVCPVFGSCGGCAWQHIAYEAQVEAKRRILADALVRIGKLALPARLEFVPSPAAYGYRGRARVVAVEGRVGFRRRRSHALCAVARCPLLVPALDRRLGELAARPPPDAGEWELVAGEGGVVRAAPLAPGRVRAERTVLRVGAERLAVSWGVFRQANLLLLETLTSAVAEAAGRGELALELFAGAGFLTLPLARRFRRVVAVESQAEAVADLRHNLAAAGAGNVAVVEARVEDALRRRRLVAGVPDAIVLDPPRSGLPSAALGRLAAVGARRLVYLSCDPATLARDLAWLVGQGLRLTGVVGFDLFPQSPHVEALAVLQRARPVAARTE